MSIARAVYLITLDEDWGDYRKNRVVTTRDTLEAAQYTAAYYRKLRRKNVRVLLEVTTQTVIDGPPL